MSGLPWQDGCQPVSPGCVYRDVDDKVNFVCCYSTDLGNVGEKCGSRLFLGVCVCVYSFEVIHDNSTAEVLFCNFYVCLFRALKLWYV